MVTESKEESKFVKLNEVHADYDWNSRHKSFRDEPKPVNDDGKEVEPAAGSLWSVLKSIQTVGQDVAVIVRPTPAGAKHKRPYELVAGFRRFWCLEKSAHEKINVPVPRGVVSSITEPVVKIEVRNLDEREARALNGRENIERENLSTCDQAYIVRRMVSEGMSDVAIAGATGMSNGHISQLHRITDTVHPDLLEMWRGDKVVQAALSLDKLEKIGKLQAGEGDKKSPDLKEQTKVLNEVLESKSTRGGNKGKWIDSACRQAAAIGTLLGSLEYAELIDTGNLSFTNVKHVQALVAGDLLVIKGKDGAATEKQWEKIAAAAAEAYETAVNPPEEEEEEEEETEAKTGTKKKAAGTKAA
jgi:ParB-like chromosome segregation protein Spo0J